MRPAVTVENRDAGCIGFRLCEIAKAGQPSSTVPEAVTWEPGRYALTQVSGNCGR